MECHCHTKPLYKNGSTRCNATDVATGLCMPEDRSQTKFLVASKLRELLVQALQEADRLRLDFVGIKISEALDALDAAENEPSSGTH